MQLSARTRGGCQEFQQVGIAHGACRRRARVLTVHDHNYRVYGIPGYPGMDFGPQKIVENFKIYS